MKVIAVGSQQPHIQTHQAHVVGNVPSHAPQAQGYGAGIGVGGHQRGKGTSADVHIHAAYHHGVGAAAQNVALSGDAALLHQIGDMHRHGRTGDAQLIRNLLLGDHGIGFDQLQNLPLPLGHDQTS